MFKTTSLLFTILILFVANSLSAPNSVNEINKSEKNANQEKKHKAEVIENPTKRNKDGSEIQELVVIDENGYPVSEVIREVTPDNHYNNVLRSNLVHDVKPETMDTAAASIVFPIRLKKQRPRPNVRYPNRRHYNTHGTYRYRYMPFYYYSMYYPRY